MILFKRFTVCALCVAVTLTSVSFFKSAEKISVMSENSDIRPTIIIDAGHGGFDGGALAEDGTLEKDLNLKIAKRLKHLLLHREQ
jgi:N-acetylmuramoyl-L-alanine amidase